MSERLVVVGFTREEALRLLSESRRVEFPSLAALRARNKIRLALERVEPEPTYGEVLAGG